MEPAKSAKTEAIFTQDGFEFKYSPELKQVTLEAVDYHSGKVILTPDIVQKLTTFMAGKGLFHTTPRNGEKIEQPYDGDVSESPHRQLRKSSHGMKVLMACLAGIAIGSIITKSIIRKKSNPSA
jgi:hypothetical protein